MLFFQIAENPPSLIAEGIFRVFVRRERKSLMERFLCMLLYYFVNMAKQ